MAKVRKTVGGSAVRVEVDMGKHTIAPYDTSDFSLNNSARVVALVSIVRGEGYELGMD